MFNPVNLAVSIYVWVIVCSISAGMLLVLGDSKYKFKYFFALYDFWGGVYWDKKREILYVNPLPTIVISFASSQNVWDEREARWKISNTEEGMRTKQEVSKQLDLAQKELEQISKIEMGTCAWRNQKRYVEALEWVLKEEL